MKSSLLAAAVAALTITGCEPPGPAVAPIGYLQLSTPRRPFDTLKVSPTELVSPDVQLYKVDDGFRGTVKGQPIDIAIVSKGRLKGSRGGLPIDMHVNHDAESIVARGLFGGRLVSIRFSKLGIGSCGPAQLQAQEEGEGAGDPCNTSQAALVGKMIEQLGEDQTAAYLATAYFR
jgi:hypothetical protein